jgi:hypothetical protein
LDRQLQFSFSDTAADAGCSAPIGRRASQTAKHMPAGFADVSIRKQAAFLA